MRARPPEPSTEARNGGPILVVEEIEKWFTVGRSLVDIIRRKPAGRIHAVDGVSLHLLPNEVLGIVGESGSGKSTLARCLVALYRPDRGRIIFDGIDVAEAGGQSQRDLHGRMQMIYQDPFTSLNPQMSIGAAIGEAGKVHGRSGEGFVHELLDVVGLPRSMEGRRPRALSGGQRQRAAIARALAVQPEVLIADEVVSALDVSIQAQILNLFSRLSDDLGSGHDLHRPRSRRGVPCGGSGGHHVPGTDRRGGPGRSRIPIAPAPVHEGAARRPPRSLRAPRCRRVHPHLGRHPFTSRHPVGMPVQDPLPLRDGCVRGGRSSAPAGWRAASSRMSRAAVRASRLGLTEAGALPRKAFGRVRQRDSSTGSRLALCGRKAAARQRRELGSR